MRQRRILLCCFLMLSFTAKAEVVGGIRFSGTTEINDGDWRNSLAASPYINYLYSTTRVDFNSSASANLSTLEGFQLSPLNWLASADTIVKLPLPSLSATAGASHNVSDTLFEDRLRITDSINVGLLSNFDTGRSLSHSIATNYRYTNAKVETNGNETSSETIVGTASYTATRIQATGSALSFNITGQDYFNDTTSLSTSATYVRPRPTGTLTLSLGATSSVQSEQGSLALTGLASYSRKFQRNISGTVSVSKTRTDSNSLILLDELEIETPSQDIVDVTTGTVSLAAPALNGRLNNSASYSLSYIETVFILEEASLFGGDSGYSDVGTVTSSYALSEYSSISVSSQFSLREQTAVALGNIEYKRELAPELFFSTGISSSDFSEGITRYYATLSYNLGLIQSNE